MTAPIRTLALAALAATALAAGARAQPAPPREPETMTYDFRTGIKSTTFTDGTVVEEAFDARKARKFVPRPEGSDVTTSLPPR